MIKGPSQNSYGQRGEGVDDFVTYHYVYFEGEGGVFYEIVTYWQMRTKKAQTSTFSALRNHQNEDHR